MSAGAVAVGVAEAREPLWHRLLRTPSEGWSSLLLLAIMLLTVGLAIDDSRWAGNAPVGGSQTGFVPVALLLGGLSGFVLARTRMSTLSGHLVSASVGAAFLLVAAANSVSANTTLFGRLQDLSASASTFFNDVFVLGARSNETSAFLLAIGAVAWTTGYFSAWNVFRRGRATPAVVAAGLVLLVNMSITARIQYPHLVVLAVAAMLLLVRVNLAHQQLGWRRRHIGDGSDVSGLFLRGGVLFVALTLTGAITLAATASSAPLASVWRNMDDQLVAVSLEVDRLVGGVTGSTKQTGGLFSSAETIRSFWESNPRVIFTDVPSDGEGHYWRGAAYDSFDGQTWKQSDKATVDVPAQENLLAASADNIANPAKGRTNVSIEVTSVDLAGGTVLAPDAPFQVDHPTHVQTDGQAGPLLTIDFSGAISPGDTYTITSLVQNSDLRTGGISAADLAQAGVDYPGWALAYTNVPANSMGTAATAAADSIVARLPAEQRDPYHVADAVQRYLDRDGGFRYQTDVRGLCGRESIIDCLMRTKVGFCQYFASARVMMLRHEQIPARFVEGYLPGKLLPDGHFAVDASAAHAWAEVYFPTYGWVRFDPTPGNVENGRAATVLPPGTPSASQKPGQAGVQKPTFHEDRPVNGVDVPPEGVPPQGEPAPGPGTPANPGVIGPLAITGLLVGAVLLALIARRRRLFSPEPDVAYRGVARMASRFGYGPKPHQTAYEYAGTLSDVLPGISEELHIVAHARVETVYAHRPPTGDALARLRAAYRRVRLGLLRLFFRRRGRPRK
jgi:transglutaminase-like putative cysteine protease